MKMISCCQECRHEAGPSPAWQNNLGALHLMGRAPQRLHINYMYKVAAYSSQPTCWGTPFRCRCCCAAGARRPHRRRRRAGERLQGGCVTAWPWRLVHCGGKVTPCRAYIRPSLHEAW